ncbi:oxidoreductase FAD/NAD(P)-binding domain protein [Chloroherpeton thalassium ATCC 35110]|uniref:Oxidoreductase FAD/NAD(P)-binding domain protein n=1 Tax=Chloroherpeton thalassium (strain ATCC 35110 / GB-78) TaxID=517418 RepID=B3QTM0_CHLT3|nr:dihydroorotate dehydrogenase electron transfer subunit [Chloroherpeton thalassium]ACF12766.1 oxidoreductase FAD/NAD(P)-binding domain protein [Chloroherpeton thalassium ATCC 35110]
MTHMTEATTKADDIFDLSLTVQETTQLNATTAVLAFKSELIAPLIKPGQFVNIKVNDTLAPLLRRPLSVHRVEGDIFEVMVKVVGSGTKLLYNALPGSTVQVLGPLGNSFDYARQDYDTAILVSGGVGVAPMTILDDCLRQAGKEIFNYVGGRTASDIIARKLTNLRIATDDGSQGFKGTVVALLEQDFPEFAKKRVRIFSCGPNRMLQALADFSMKKNIPCEVSLESVMGCGIGICYGCPVHVKNEQGEPDGHKLLCQHGPVMDAKQVVFE